MAIQLRMAMDDFELRFRLNEVLYGTADYQPPTVSRPPVPAEDIDPEDPEHRATHLEFLAETDPASAGAGP